MGVKNIISRWLPLFGFRSSRDYWQRRYSLGGNSGEGSYGEPALYKAQVLNAFVRGHGVGDVIEFGCGDGHQLTLAEYPRYTGIDVSSHAVALCRERFSHDVSKRFLLLDEYAGERAQLALSLDVLFHLVEDEVYDQYLRTLFTAADEFVIVYSTSTGQQVKTMPHVRHRAVEFDIARRFPDFRRMHEEERQLPPPVQSGSGLATKFFLYARAGNRP